MNIYNRLRRLIFGLTINTVDDSGELQTTQIGSDSLRTARRPQDYGLATNPPEGSVGVGAFIDGDPSRGVVLVVDSPEARPKNLKEGEVVLYAQAGAEIRLTEDGNIAITAGRVSIGGLVVEGSELSFNGRRVALAGDSVTTPNGPGSIDL